MGRREQKHSRGISEYEYEAREHTLDGSGTELGGAEARKSATKIMVSPFPPLHLIVLLPRFVFFMAVNTEE